MLKVLPTLLSLGVSCLGMGALLQMPMVFIASVNAAELPVLQHRGKLRVAVKSNLPPLAMRQADGNLAGFEIEIARRLAADILPEGLALELVPVSNADRLSVVLRGEVDLVIARLTATEMRSRVVVFSVPYYLDGTALVTKSSALRHTRDAERVTIAVLNGSSTIATLRDRLPGARLVAVSSYIEAKQQLERGTVEAFAADVSILTGWVQAFPEFRLLHPLLSVEPLAIALPKGKQHDPLRRRVNRLIETWHVDGWLEARARYWGLPWQKTLTLEPLAAPLPPKP